MSAGSGQERRSLNANSLWTSASPVIKGALLRVGLGPRWRGEERGGAVLVRSRTGLVVKRLGPGTGVQYLEVGALVDTGGCQTTVAAERRKNIGERKVKGEKIRW